MYAHDFSRWGDVVTQCIEAHIRRVSGLLSSAYRFPVPSSASIRVTGEKMEWPSKIILLDVLLYLCL